MPHTLARIVTLTAFGTFREATAQTKELLDAVSRDASKANQPGASQSLLGVEEAPTPFCSLTRFGAFRFCDKILFA